MNSDTAWKIFESTGSIRAYLTYRGIDEQRDHASSSVDRKEDLANAGQYGWNRDQRTEHR